MVEAQLLVIDTLGSWVGTVSVPYEIHRCHRGSIWALDFIDVSISCSPGVIGRLFGRSRYRAGHVRIEVMLLVVYPSCAYYVACQYEARSMGRGQLRTWEFIVVLVELVAGLVDADQNTSLGITYPTPSVFAALPKTSVSFCWSIPMYCNREREG